jgi:hypothetical protein
MWPGCVPPSEEDLVDVDPGTLATMDEGDLRRLARALGVLVEGEAPEAIRMRIHRCQIEE